MESDDLFDATILKEIDFQSKARAKYRYNISIENPGALLLLRPLKRSDFEKGHLEVMKELTVVGDISYEQYRKRFDEMLAPSSTYFIVVIEDLNTSKVIASGTLFVERKFIRHCNKRGHIEDISVLKSYRDRELGKLMVDTLIMIAEHQGCYKVSLDCSNPMVGFYKKLGFRAETDALMIRF